MIFATVGTQLPFDRLVRTLDEWASQNKQVEIFAQIGQTNYVPRHMRWERAIPANTFRAMLRKSDTVVAHAGMGTIISAIELGRQVVVMPRRADLNEHRNDHQLATVERLKHLSGLDVAHDCQALTQFLDQSRDLTTVSKSVVSPDMVVSAQLIRKIRSFAGLPAA
jgi:UDP-N-acetylglucosamine transferase subunit ALG13